MEKSKRINGIKVTYIRNSPVEKLQQMGRAIRSKKRLEKDQFNKIKVTEKDRIEMEEWLSSLHKEYI